MTALNVKVLAPLDQYVEEQVRNGAFPDAESVVRAGLALLREDDAARTARFEALVQEGLDELDRGEGIEIDDVKAWLDSLGPS